MLNKSLTTAKQRSGLWSNTFVPAGYSLRRLLSGPEGDKFFMMKFLSNTLWLILLFFAVNSSMQAQATSCKPANCDPKQCAISKCDPSDYDPAKCAALVEAGKCTPEQAAACKAQAQATIKTVANVAAEPKAAEHEAAEPKTTVSCQSAQSNDQKIKSVLELRLTELLSPAPGC